MSSLSPDFEQQLEAFLKLAGKQAFANASPAAFTDWFALAAPKVFPALTSQIADDPQELKRFLRMAAKNLYADFPQPALGLHPPGRTKLGRNDPCDCGSGLKFKLCCGSSAMPPLFGQLNLLRYVLDACPKSRLVSVAASKASVDAVADTAYQWLQEGAASRAAALLEPYFTSTQTLTERLCPLFNLLMDTWFEMGLHRKRDQLIDSILERGDRPLRSDALQRRTTMLADQGDHGQAWRCFKQASELNPNDPALSFLEVTTLLSEGRTDEAQARAQWWASFLAKQRDPALEEVISRLRHIAKDPHAGMMGVALQTNADWQRLNDLFLKAPTPTLRHQFDVFEQENEDGVTHLEADVLVPDAELARLEVRWKKLFVQIKPDMTRLQHDNDAVWDNAPQWLDLLQRHPSLWFSFEVLDDLVMAVDTIHVAGIEERLLVPMAERAVEQLRITLERAAVQPVQCHWGMLGHRPVLRPIAHLAYLCQAEASRDPRKAQRFMELARWMVFDLNPNDNHGLRSDLSNAFIRFERWEDALALNDRYPDDMQPTLPLNALLAAFALQQDQGLDQRLKQAAKTYSPAVNMLLGPVPKPVKPDNSYGVALGGKYEAWLYVRDMRAIWEKLHALEWARAVLAAKARKSIPVPPEQSDLF